MSKAKKSATAKKKTTTKTEAEAESPVADLPPQQDSLHPIPDFAPIHQWTNGGDKVLLIKCVAKGGKSHNDFQWPKSGTVTTPNWSPIADCESGGLFGWAWGLNIGGGKEPNYSGDWIVYAASPASVIEIDAEKSKAGPSAEVVYYGDWAGALEFTRSGREAWMRGFFDNVLARSQASQDSGSHSTGVRGASSSTGEGGASSSTGVRGASSSTGVRGASSSTGVRGASSSTGYGGASSSTGYGGASSSTGEGGAASLTGIFGTIEVGPKSAGVVTADEFFWRIHLGAVVLHRWETGHKTLTTENMQEGSLAHIRFGEIVAIKDGAL